MNDEMRRRDFLRRLPGVTTGLAAGVASLPLAACAGARHVVPSRRMDAWVVPARELDDGGGAVFLSVPGAERPVYVSRNAGGEVFAVLASCTHRGCQPEPVGARLVCPCHGSEFALDGRLLQGPAERPLTRYEVTVDGGDLLVRMEGSGR